MDRHLNYFQFLVITNKVAIALTCKSLCGHMHSFLLHKNSGVEWLMIGYIHDQILKNSLLKQLPHFIFPVTIFNN